MGRLIYDTSMSLDGFITGPNPRSGDPLGEGGDQLHTWMSGIADFRFRHDGSGGEASANAKVRDELHRRTGAILIGRKIFEVGEEPWGSDPPFAMPMFVVTHRPQSTMTKEGGTTYTFVTEGIESALEQAREVAGDKDVLIVGGANIARQYLQAGLLDEIEIHLVPLLLGAGVKLFEGAEQLTLELTRTIESTNVTHLRYRVAE
jgi:dihydrofolate reductase